MRIGLYGCSWAAGRDWKAPSIGEELAKENKDWIIYNYARAGIGMDAIAYLYEKTAHKNDFNIVKFTGMNRKTIIHEDLNLNLDYGCKKITENYFKLNKNNISNFATFRAVGYFNSDKFNTSILESGYECYMTYRKPDYLKTLSIILANFLKYKADIAYCHRKDHGKVYLVESTENFIDNFDSYVYDEGFHFNEEGCNVEAKWLTKKINTVH